MRPRWRSVGRRRPTTHRLRPQQSGGRRGRDFLVSRGMAAPPAGEESRDALWRHRRSRRQPSFGQISPLKRPFGALAERIGSGEAGDQPRLKKQQRVDRRSSSFRACVHCSDGSRTPSTYDPAITEVGRRVAVFAGLELESDRTPWLGPLLADSLHRPFSAESFSMTRWRLRFAWPAIRRVAHIQACAWPWLDWSEDAIPAIRTNDTTPTATAPTMENAICHPSDGMTCFATPWVA